MLDHLKRSPLGCSECTQSKGLDFDFTMAFQPIVNVATRQVFAQEALARGVNNDWSLD